MMAQKEKGEPLYPATETGSRLWSNICTLIGIAWAARVDLGNARERMITLIRRLEEGDKGHLVLDSLHRETVDEQYKRLFMESALPVAIDNGEEMIVSSYGGKHQEGHPFPEHVTLLHRDANKTELRGEYRLTGSFSSPSGTSTPRQDIATLRSQRDISFILDVSDALMEIYNSSRYLEWGYSGWEEFVENEVGVDMDMVNEMLGISFPEMDEPE